MAERSNNNSDNDNYESERCDIFGEIFYTILYYIISWDDIMRGLY